MSDQTRTRRHGLDGRSAGSLVHGRTSHADKREYLRAVDIFRDLPPTELFRIDAMTRMMFISRGSVIYHQDDNAEALFLLKDGRVSICRITSSGRRIDLALLESGTFFGEMPALGERMRRTSAVALADCVLCVMTSHDVEQMVLSWPHVGLRMLQTIGGRLASAEGRLEDLSYRSVRTRLASLLLRLDEESHGPVIGLTHRDLGARIGAHRETVTKALDDLERDGVIATARRHIQILRRDVLGDMLNE